MAFVNLPPNLQDIFKSITDRVAKLETGPNQAMYTADAAQSVATTAQIQAINAGIQANNAASQATIAQSQATIASTQATTANATANGKNKVTYSTSAPGSTANSVGDIWYQYGISGTYANKVIAQYSGAGGTSWTSVTVSGLVIANIDAGAITTGTLSAIQIDAGSGSQKFNVSSTGYMSAQGAYIKGNITADSGTFNGTIKAADGYFGSFAGGNYWSIGASGITGVGSATITAGAINGSSITTNTGTIAGWVMSSGSGGYLTNSGSDTFLYSTPGSDGVAISTIGRGVMRRLQLNGASGTSLGTNTLAVGGTMSVDSDATIAGNIRSVGTTNTTTGAAANMFINATSGLMARSTASSQRYKHDIVNLTDVPELDPTLLYNLPVRAFRFNENYLPNTDERSDTLVPGFIAEEIDALYPSAVDYNEGNAETWNDRILIPALLALIQDLNNRVKTLEATNT